MPALVDGPGLGFLWALLPEFPLNVTDLASILETQWPCDAVTLSCLCIPPEIFVLYDKTIAVQAPGLSRTLGPSLWPIR
jgi:hypothetical protein